MYANRKYIGGEEFELKETFRKKRDATAYAKKYRKKGEKVRIIKSEKGKKTYYDVYIS